jgi:hypothetical protein
MLRLLRSNSSFVLGPWYLARGGGSLEKRVTENAVRLGGAIEIADAGVESRGVDDSSVEGARAPPRSST